MTHSLTPKAPSPEALERFRSRWTIVPELGIVLNRKTGQEIGSLDISGYVKIWNGWDSTRPRISRSHLMWWAHHNEWPKQQLDHKDRNRANDAIANLGEVTSRENAANGARSVNRTLPVGVTAGTFKAQITVHGRIVFLGYFDTVEEAVAARQQALELINAGHMFTSVDEFRNLLETRRQRESLTLKPCLE